MIYTHSKSTKKLTSQTFKELLEIVKLSFPSSHQEALLFVLRPFFRLTEGKLTELATTCIQFCQVNGYIEAQSMLHDMFWFLNVVIKLLR